MVVRSPGGVRRATGPSPCSCGRMPLLGRCFRVGPSRVWWVLRWSDSEPVRVTGARGCAGLPAVSQRALHRRARWHGPAWVSHPRPALRGDLLPRHRQSQHLASIHAPCLGAATAFGDRSAARPPDPPCTHSRDERRELPAQPQSRPHEGHENLTPQAIAGRIQHLESDPDSVPVAGTPNHSFRPPVATSLECPRGSQLLLRSIRVLSDVDISWCALVQSGVS